MKEVLDLLNHTHQLDLPIKKFTKKEVNLAIRRLNQLKAPGYDLITAKIIRELSEEGITFLTQLYNAILRRGFVPLQWKVAQIIIILKPGKCAEDVKSYRPISLLSIPSKILEVLFLKRLMPIIETNQLIPDHQFGFRQNHSTIEQIHRLVGKINTTFEQKKYCSAAFLDVSQAFDRVWHEGFLFKIKSLLPINFYDFIKSYLSNRHFFVKQREEVTNLYTIQACVPGQCDRPNPVPHIYI
ncbi:pol protein [Lasius niger]|uniref:Pol protein n=1 Tax=Lasius niger TaxID=67767 RepID=A0A0J7MUV7_LASNI|nr:pol protein [Lasius niger]